MLSYPQDHIGIAVTDLPAAIDFYRQNFGYELELQEDVPSQQVRVAFLKLPNTKIELLTPLSQESSLGRFIAKRGPGLHHIAFCVKDISDELQRLADCGFDLVDKTPRSGAHNTQIAFIHPRSSLGVLIELVQHST